MSAIRKRLGDFIAIVVLIAVASVVSVYILQQQRLRIPFVDETPFVLNAEFSTAQAVIAGQGQTVRVAGVRIGDIGAVKLRDGRAVVRMDIDQRYKDLVRTDARALLRPKTGLKDMFIDLDPGSDAAPVAREKWTVPISATQPDVNPDEIFAMLDADTRDYLRLLISGLGKGLKGRGPDLRDVFRRFEPTHRDLARVNSAVATRRANLRRLVTSLNRLNGQLASNGDDLAELVDTSAAVFDAFASESGNVSGTVRELPTALAQTTDTLERVERFARVLRPAATRLRPAARALDPANRAVRPFAREAAPQLRRSIRPFVRESRPLLRDLRPASTELASAAPDLTETFEKANRFFNLIAHNPKGREGPGDRARQEGYLFWLAWVQHMGLQLFSNSDAHGTLRPLTVASPCNTVKAIVEGNPELEFLQSLTPILTSSEACAR